MNNTIYYQYVANEQNVIVQINSSSQPFESNSINLPQVLKIRLGKTKVEDL
jgi:hypothetical protein